MRSLRIWREQAGDVAALLNVTTAFLRLIRLIVAPLI